MDAASQPQGTPQVHRRRRRRHRPKGWRAVPKQVFVIVGVCLAVLILIPVVRSLTRRPEAAQTVTPSRQYTSLLLNESHLDRATRRIVGVIANPSPREYQNVVVSYTLMDNTGAETGATVATVARIAANSSAPFASEPLPAGARGYSLREITGTPK